MSPLFGTIYDAVVLLAHALNHSESQGAGLSGASLGNHTGTLDVTGFSQRIRTNERGRRLAQYVILDTDGQGSQLVPTYVMDTATWQVKPLGKAIHFPGGAPPASDSSCWFDPNTLCMRGNSLSTHPSTIPSHSSIHPFIHLSTHLFTTHPSLYPSIHPSNHPHLSTSAIYPSPIHPSPIHLPITHLYMSTHPSALPPIHPSNYPSITHPLIHPSLKFPIWIVLHG